METGAIRIETCGVFRTPAQLADGSMTKLRRVELYEFELFIKPGCKSIVNGKSYIQQHGSLLFARPGDLRQSIVPFECHYIHVSLDNANRDTAAWFRQYTHAFPVMLKVFDVQTYEALFRSIAEAMVLRYPSYELLIQAKLLELLSLLYRQSVRYSTKQEPLFYLHQAAIHKAEAFINANYDKPLSLSQIAAAANLSPSYFHMLFKKIMRMTPYQYLRNARLNAAKKLLAAGQLSLSDISEVCGFDNQSYFASVFKKQTGLTPREFRAQNTVSII